MATYNELTRDELKKLIDDNEDFVLIDTLGEVSYIKAHLPGAIEIDAHNDDFVEKVKEHAPDMSKDVIVYCASFSCKLSNGAAEKLVEAGYEKVHDYAGGLQDWAQGGFEFEGEKATEMQAALAKSE